jgi:hypothetical protein
MAATFRMYGETMVMSNQNPSTMQPIFIFFFFCWEHSGSVTSRRCSGGVGGGGISTLEKSTL